MKTIFLLFDSLNRMALNCYGGPVETPNFDRLAEKGIRFSNHYAGSLPCMPARRDMQTGRYNFFHSAWGPMEPYDNSLPQMLSAGRGTYTHLITDHFHYFEPGGAGYHTRFNSFEFIRGQEYDAWKAEVEPDLESFNRQYDRRHYDFTGDVRSNHRIQHVVNKKHGYTCDEDFPTVQCMDAALGFLETNHDADNWFLQVECFDPHEPFDVPDEYLERFGVHEEMVLNWPHYQKVSETPDEVENIRRRYAALVALCDDQLGRVLDFMDEHDMWKDTAVVLTTDHGFLLSEHEWWAKVFMPNYQEISHIPLMIYHPDYAASGGENRECVTSTIDLMPTMLDFYQLSAPGEVCGESLVPSLMKDSKVERTVACGVFGGSCLLTDGRYAYHYFPQHLDSTDLYEYRLHPSHMRADFTTAELSEMELYHGFDFTKGIGILKIKARDDSKRVPNHDALGFQDRGTRLFDLSTDPQENTPIHDEAVELRFQNELRKIMRTHDAPKEMYTRFNLHKEETAAGKR